MSVARCLDPIPTPSNKEDRKPYIRRLAQGIELGGSCCLPGSQAGHSDHVPLLHGLKKLLVMLVPALYLQQRWEGQPGARQNLG